MDQLLENAGYPKSGDIPVLNRKIFRGHRVTIREHPYVASIRRQLSHYLTGALLTKNLVVTVAHPLYKVPVTELGVVLGECYSDRGSAVLTVLLVIVHPLFDAFTLQDDIALLRLFEESNYKTCAKFIQLVSPTARLNGSRAFVTGWGRCDSTVGSEICMTRSSKYYPDERLDPMLRSVSFVLSPSSYYCEGYSRHDVNMYPGMLCLGPAREEDPVCPCLAVPGAPLVVEARLAGLLSWGFGCGYGHDLPLVYTDIQNYSGWILSNTVILRKIKQTNLTSLFQATKAYLLAQWLIETRVIPPTLTIIYGNNLEPLDVDQELVKLKGTVYDVRDFINNGSFHGEKLLMYEDIRTLQRKTLQILKIRNEALKRLNANPFLNKNVIVGNRIASDTVELHRTTKIMPITVNNVYEDSDYYTD